MSFHWLKRFLPRSLYGRAALILLAPVVVLQLVVSVAFTQRQLVDVTTQMTLNIVREIVVLEDLIAAAADRDAALISMSRFADAFAMDVSLISTGDVPDSGRIRWYDLSARVARDAIQSYVPQTLLLDFPDNRIVLTYFRSPHGVLKVSFNRRRISAATPHQLILTMVFFSFLMTVIAYLYLRNQLRPITRLARAAQAFGRGRTIPYTPGGATEVRVAGSAFLDMRARIERQIEQRTTMLSGVSHDLRTPLTRLKLGLAMLDEDEAGLMLGDVNEMERMLDAFLEFARGASESAAESVDPHALVRRIVEDAKRAGVIVHLGEMRGQGEVMLRATAIRRAVENLLGNAFRYGDSAEVSVVLTEKSLRIRVEDDGPGIPADQRAEVVKPFFRLDPARNQNKGGSVGLGLTIVADIARAHGGALRLGISEKLGGLQADIVIGR
jgi:two-component system, OmpR family, osmolarity sensor histidine kinase EnvZ